MTRQFEGLVTDAALEPYLALADGDRRLAGDFLDLDIAVGDAFQPSLRGLTHALGYRVHAALSEDHGEDWLERDHPTLMPWQRREASGTMRSFASEGEPPDPLGVALALPLGFWVSMFAPEFQRLWDATLHRILQAENGPGPARGEIAWRLARIEDAGERSRRSTAPIIHLELDAIHADIVRLTRRLSPALADLYEPLNLFPDARFDERLSLVPRKATGTVN